MSDITERQYKQTVQNRTRRRRTVQLDAVVAEVLIAKRTLAASSRHLLQTLVAGFLARHVLPTVRVNQEKMLPGYAGKLCPEFLLSRELRIVLEWHRGGYYKHGAAERTREMELFARGGVDEVWHFPGNAIKRNVAATLARFVLTHAGWFDAGTRTEFETAGITTSPDFAPVAAPGWYTTPTPKRARVVFRAYWAASPAKRMP